MDRSPKFLIPDWHQCDSVVFIWPEHLDSGVNSLKGEYEYLINSIIKYQNKKIIILTDNPDSIDTSGLHKQPEVIRYDVNDIWIKDFAPLQISENGIIKYIKPIYSPQYLALKKDRKYAVKGNEAGKGIPELSGRKLLNLVIDGKHIILDGGNITTNGSIAILTNRIISDNETISIENLRAGLEKSLGIRKLMFVPVEHGDITGHIDSMVRFLNSDTVAVAGYPDYPEFHEGLAEQLRKEGLRVIRIMNSYPEANNGFPYATGNYLNFLRIEDNIYLPSYKGQDDYFHKAEKSIKQFCKEVIRIPADKIAERGGVLNCITHVNYHHPLFKAQVPDSESAWEDISEFALTFNGYEYSDHTPKLANKTFEDYCNNLHAMDKLHLEELRACLFYEQRRARFSGYPVQGLTKRYISDLLKEIRIKAID